MKSWKLLVFISLFTLCITNAVKSQEKINQRPTIGLVLSGGGAKGFAHIGVLKVLEEAGIRPDYIAGTSMGGIVSGLYAIGYSVDSLEKIVKTTNWAYYLSDDIPRRSITLEEKEDHDRYSFSIPVSEKGLNIPGGVINGQNIETLLNQLCSKVYSTRNFSEFDIPFACNATDIETGKEVVFQDGYLPEVLRATMSIPSIFNPVKIDGKLLVDGGLVNNFPVNHVKAMGADIIIGVDVGFQLYSQVQLNSMFKIIEQSLFFYGEENNIENRSLCNLVIYPQIKDYSAGSFNSADTIMAIGEAAARKLFPQLKALADSLKAIDPSFGQRTHPVYNDSLFLSDIQVQGLEKVSNELLMGKLQLHVNQTISVKDISQAINRAYASLYFEKVGYELDEIPSGTQLKIKVIEKSGGSIRFGLHYDSNYKAAILLNTTFRNFILDGSKYSISGALGENPFFKAEFFKNNGWKPGFGMNFQTSLSETFIYNKGLKISSLDFYESKVQLYTESIFLNSHGIGAGIEFENSTLKPVIDPTGIIPESRYKLVNYYAFLQMDSYDNPFYPTRGNKVYTGIKLITSENLKPVPFIHARINHAEKLSDRFTLISHIYGGSVYGDSIPAQYEFFSGGTIESSRNGLMPFPGLDYMEISSKNCLILKMDLQARLFKNIYLTGMINAGSFKDSFNDLLQPADILGGYGLNLGYNSLIGPIEFSVSHSANYGGVIGYIRIGYWFF